MHLLAASLIVAVTFIILVKIWNRSIIIIICHLVGGVRQSQFPSILPLIEANMKSAKRTTTTTNVAKRIVYLQNET